MKSTVTFVCCDKCGSKTPMSSEFTYCTGSCVDASGNNARLFLDFDLCPVCQQRFIEYVLTTHSRDSKIIECIKKFVPKVREVEA